MKQPLVSIVVLTYNQERSLPVTLDSLLKQQTTFPFEIMVGEDCSTDATRKVLADYVSRYPEVIIPIYNENNKGILNNYISTLSHCRGKYIAGCAGDDYWHDPMKLQMQVDIMEQDPTIGLVYTDVIVDSIVTNERFERKSQDLQDNVFEQLLKGCFITAPTVCYRAELLDYIDFSIFSRLGFIMEDYPMWLTFSLHTKFYHLGKPTITYKIERSFINDAKTVSLHACKFDESSTAIRLYFLKNYPDRTKLTENDILDEHHKMGYLAGLNMNDRLFTLRHVKSINNRGKYVKRLTTICSSRVLFSLYQWYRCATGKMRSPLQMYFGQ